MNVLPVERDEVRSKDGTPLGVRSVGAGPGLIVVGGALRTAADYLPFARALSGEFRVHVVDRRGRGASGPQGSSYGIAAECEDLLAVQAATGARKVFGHSYGGLIALETVARAPAFEQVAVYEPGLPVGDSVPLEWLPGYRSRLEAGDRRGAFAWFVRGSGHAPAVVGRLPFWYLRAVMRVVVRGERWRRFDVLLESNLLEHEQLARIQQPVERFSAITAEVLLMRGGRSPATIVAEPLETLERILPRTRTEILPDLAHNAPDEQAPARVADHVRAFMKRDGWRGSSHRAERGALEGR